MKKGLISAVAMIAAMVGAGVGASVVRRSLEESTKRTKKMSEKHLALFFLMNQWVKVKQEGKSLHSYFEKKGYKKIAIYGMSYVGETLFRELRDTDIQVAYGIDQKAEGIYADINIVSLEDTLEEVDAVIVTAITFFDEIKEDLKNKLHCPIISLEDILYQI